MRRFFLPALGLVVLVLLYTFAWRGQQERADLVVYAYPSFVAVWGAGPKIVEQYQKECGCRVELVEAGHSALLVQRLLLEKHAPQADVVIGLDQFSLTSARELPWRNLKQVLSATSWNPDLPQSRGEEDFLPIDWSPLTFIYRRTLKTPPRTLRELLQAHFRRGLSLEDPRNSALGFQFIAWGMALWGEEAGTEYLSQLQTQVMAWSPSWSTAYGFFKQGQAQMAFSYLTSLIYHWGEEKDESFQALSFSHQHPYQVEYLGVPKSCRNCGQAETFVGFLLRPDTQKTLAESNYMLPSVASVDLKPIYQKLPKIQLLAEEQMTWVQSHRHEILEAWKQVNQRSFGHP